MRKSTKSQLSTNKWKHSCEMYSLLSTILCWSKNFTSSSTMRLLTAVPLNKWLLFREKTHKEEESYSIIARCGVCACFEHKFCKVNASAPLEHLAKSIKVAPRGRGLGQTVARLVADHQLDPKIQLPCNWFWDPTVVLQ